MSTSNHSILFLSGAGLQPWIWDDVRRELGEARETGVAARPAGHHAGLREYAEAAVESAPAGPFVIVAHSAGGVIGAEVARLAPERVTALLAVSAIMPPPGGSFISAMPIPNRWILGALMRVTGTRPPESVIRGSLARGLDPRTADRIVADFTPETQRFYRDRIGEPPWEGRAGYVITTADRELNEGLQRQYATRLSASWRRELGTGHLPMLESPAALAEIVAEFMLD